MNPAVVMLHQAPPAYLNNLYENGQEEQFRDAHRGLECVSPSASRARDRV